MTSRERVIRSMKFENPDRVPVLHRIKPGYFRIYEKEIGELRERYPSDILQSEKTHTWFTFYSEGKLFTRPGELNTDEWGCTWATTTDDYLGQVVDSPLKSWDDYRQYSMPDPHHGVEGIAEMDAVRRDDRSRHYMLVWIGSIFHTYTYLRGAENALIDTAEQKPGFFSLLDMLLEFLLKRIEILSDHDLDGIFISDDWGSQQSLMIDPEQWRRIFKPRYTQLAEAIHERGFFAHYHTCGFTLPILGDLVECGFDEINPQVPLMDKDELAGIFAGRTCIRPDLQRQGVLIHGTPLDVEAHVRETFDALKSPGGGYIGHIPVEMNVPLANVEAMMRTYSELTFE
jgi:uroporphyrinogen decarboxylase